MLVVLLAGMAVQGTANIKEQRQVDEKKKNLAKKHFLQMFSCG